ncbi:hypothetical protein HK104_010781 [Borealophlyctis nickersoniae]|nr:hypothetical protein HK104_010781 [Borealophlyctis nickersoniae]
MSDLEPHIPTEEESNGVPMDANGTGEEERDEKERDENVEQAEVDTINGEEEDAVMEDNEGGDEEVKPGRCFPAPTLVNGEMSQEELRKVLVGLCEKVVEGFQAGNDGVVVAGTEEWDVYHGTAGVARLFVDVHLRDPNLLIAGSKPLDLAKRFIDAAVVACEAYLTKLMHCATAVHSCGYVKSPAGVWSTAAVVYHCCGAESDRDASIDRLVAMRKPAEASGAPCEVYYGRAGYLQALAYAIVHIGPHPRIPAKFVTDVFLRIIQDGRDGCGRSFARPADRSGCGQNSYTVDTPLLWSWFVERYTGAAHGMAGCLLSLMTMADFTSGRFKEDVKKSVEFIMTRKTSNGNYTGRVDETLVASPQLYKGEELVQICHGATGVALCFCRAFEVFKKQSYLEAAKEAALVVWDRGILRKGVGLCHGIAGNAYLFLKLYELTASPHYLHRATTYLREALNWDTTYAPQLRESKPKSRGEKFGLFEGLAGVAKLTMDLLWVDQYNGGFPGIMEGTLPLNEIERFAEQTA